MRAVKLFTCVCLVAGGLAVAAGNAVAAQSPAVDCNAHGYKLTRHYSAAQLEHSLATMPAQIKEYTPCYTVIQDQLYAETGRKVTGASTGSGGGGGSFLSGPLIAVVIVIVLAGGGLAFYASRRGSGGGDTPPPAAGN